MIARCPTFKGVRHCPPQTGHIDGDPTAVVETGPVFLFLLQFHFRMEIISAPTEPAFEPEDCNSPFDTVPATQTALFTTAQPQ
jgi:hypothetical protein